MQKTWVYQRKNRTGWYVGWYVSGPDGKRKRRSKSFRNKALAEQFALTKQYELNTDIFPEPVTKPWDELVAKYLDYKENVRSLVSESIRSIKHTFENFKRICGPVQSTEFTEQVVNEFVKERLQTTSKATVNKDLRNLKALAQWSVRNRYMGKLAIQIVWPKQKVPQASGRSLTKEQVHDLCVAAKKYQRYKDAWYIRVLLAVTTGLRKNDIERLKISDIDFESCSAKTFSQKTGKLMKSRPINSTVINELTRYLGTLPDRQDRLFVDKFTSGKWTRIRREAGLSDFRFHDLRTTFSTLCQIFGRGEAVAQYLLEHSTVEQTRHGYTDKELLYRAVVESLPVAEFIA